MPEKRYRTTVTVNESGGTTTVHTPIRTPEEYEEWLARWDRFIRETFPGNRLRRPDEPPAPEIPEPEKVS
ncbi:MAG: hypothetical protein IJQ25_05345 [Oscillibacter sp.]|nr:hypothetical protein [Oscillibacter sp.]